MKTEQLEAVIQLLNSMNIDGEGMEYIINGVGMTDQMLRQLIMSNPTSETIDFLEEKRILSNQGKLV
jgi:hypothetical protein